MHIPVSSAPKYWGEGMSKRASGASQANTEGRKAQRKNKGRHVGYLGAFSHIDDMVGRCAAGNVSPFTVRQG